MAVQIPIDRAAIADFCRRNHIQKLALFGSVTRDDFGPNSDVGIADAAAPVAWDQLVWSGAQTGLPRRKAIWPTRN